MYKVRLTRRLNGRRDKKSAFPTEVYFLAFVKKIKAKKKIFAVRLFKGYIATLNGVLAPERLPLLNVKAVK